MLIDRTFNYLDVTRNITPLSPFEPGDRHLFHTRGIEKPPPFGGGWGEAQNGPLPIHDVVVSAVAAAVMAATKTFNSTSQKLFLFIINRLTFSV